jgi:hypothetical protein
MRRLFVLSAFAGLALTAACSDVTHPGSSPQFSRQITFNDFQNLLGQLPAGAAARVKVELPASGVTAREVKVKDPAEVNEEEQVEGRITALMVNATGDQGTLTLAPGFTVSFTTGTRFEAGAVDLTFQEFVERVNTALAQTPQVFLAVQAERDPVNPPVLGPADAFPAAKLELQNAVGGPELRINIAGANLVALGSADCQASLSATLRGCVKVLGLTVGIDATTELEAMLPGMVEVKFEGILDCNSLSVTSAHEGAFSLVGQAGTTIQVDQNTQLEQESGDDEKLADLTAVQTACTNNQTVRVEGEGVQTAAGTVRATEVEFQVEEAAAVVEVEFTGMIEAITPPTLTVAGRVVVTDAATQIERDGMHLALTDLHVGDTVEVKGTLQSDGSVLAREIRPRS